MKARPHLNISPWAIGLFIFVPPMLVNLLLSTVARRYDATVVLQASDYAIQMRMAGASVSESLPPVRDDDRVAEAKRLASLLESRESCTKAAFYLAWANRVEENLSVTALERHPDHRAFEDTQNWVRAAQAKMTDEQRRACEANNGVPEDLWATFIYLRRQLNATPEATYAFQNLVAKPGGVEDWASVNQISSTGEVVMSVRSHNPRVAETMASAIAAVVVSSAQAEYKAPAHRAESLARMQMRQIAQRLERTRQRLSQSTGRDGPASWQSNRLSVDLSAESAELGRWSAELARAQYQLSRFESEPPVRVLYWAGNNPAQIDHPEISAYRASTRRNGAIIVASMLMGALAALIANWLAPRFRAPVEREATEAPRQPDSTVVPDF